uniref:tyrosine recombinase XerC n=1 Tax=Ndongobacter massiliensis TaxID=1871025 RepID=UPI000930EE11|nr:tyrosine recombinase XerC [Ndongobacter massiliensis]
MYEDFPPFLEDYLNYLRTVRALSSSTIREYAYDLGIFLRFIEKRLHRKKWSAIALEAVDITEMRIDDLKSVELTDLHAYLAYTDLERGDSPTTRARKTVSIRTFFDYLANTVLLLDKNPAARLQTPKVKKRHPVYLTLPEALHLIETAAKQENRFFQARDVAILVTFLTTGIRLSELCGMNLGVLREDRFTVIGKGNKERTVYLTESCREALQRYLAIRPNLPEENALFLSSRKSRMSPRAVQHRIEHFLREAGFDTGVYSTHKLRHTAATLLYREGVDIRTLQRILGHASVATTQIYTHVEDEQIRDAVQKNPLAHLSAPKSPAEDAPAEHKTFNR